MSFHSNEKGGGGYRNNPLQIPKTHRIFILSHYQQTDNSEDASLIKSTHPSIHTSLKEGSILSVDREIRIVEPATHLPDAVHGQPLSVECPQCGLVETDDYEILSADSPTSWRCSGCDCRFDVVAVDCESCWAQSYSQVLAPGGAGSTGALSCRRCGGSVFAHLDIMSGGEPDEPWH